MIKKQLWNNECIVTSNKSKGKLQFAMIIFDSCELGECKR